MHESIFAKPMNSPEKKRAKIKLDYMDDGMPSDSDDDVGKPKV